MSKYWLVLACAVCGLASASGACAQDGERISVLASGSAFPYARALVQAFAAGPARLQPSLEARDEDTVLSAFCSGVGLDSVDAVVSTMHLEAADERACRAAGVTAIEVKLGLQGLAIVESSSAPPIALTRRDLFLAAARDVPADSGGSFITNPYRTWHDIDAKLPDRPIHLLLPPAQSSERGSWIDLVMTSGAHLFPELAALAGKDPTTFAKLATTLRETGEVSALGPAQDLKAALDAAPAALAAIDLGSTVAMKGVAIDGATPDRARSGAGYPLARPVYLYVKREHLGVVRGLNEFLVQSASDQVAGEGGALAALGLVPIPARDRQAARDRLSGGAAKTHGARNP